MNCRRHVCGLASTAVMLAALSSATGAQGLDGSGRALGIVGGAFQYDLSGTGTTGFGGVRLEWPIASYVIVEPGLTYARYTTQGGTGVSLLFPEIQLQVTRPVGRVRPFIGIGAGPVVAFGGDDSETELGLSGGVGLRTRVAPDWSARAELRLRAINPWTGSAAEWTLGLSRHY